MKQLITKCTNEHCISIQFSNSYLTRRILVISRKFMCSKPTQGEELFSNFYNSYYVSKSVYAKKKELYYTYYMYSESRYFRKYHENCRLGTTYNSTMIYVN